MASHGSSNHAGESSPLLHQHNDHGLTNGIGEEITKLLAIEVNTNRMV